MPRRLDMEIMQVNVIMPRRFVKLIDQVARFTGSTRSDLIRRALERYVQELKNSNILRDIRAIEAEG